MAALEDDGLTAQAPAVRFTSVGDTAFNVEFGTAIDRPANARVMALHARLKRAAVPGLVETVPAFRSLLVVYDPTITGRRAVQAAVEAALADGGAQAPAAGRLWRLPVCYDPGLAPDLEESAAALGLTAEGLAGLHGSTEYFVYMLGFMPGFGYMGDLPAALERPRRAEPRLRVPAGSVAMAGRLTTVYPWESPGGWHLIGRCPVPLYDGARPSPILLAAGDRVRFEAVDRAGFDALARAVAEGRFDPDGLRDGSYRFRNGPTCGRTVPSPHTPGGPPPRALASRPCGRAAAVAAGYQGQRAGRSDPGIMSPPPALAVLEPGLFTTIQDLGRFGFQELGMPVAGALDPLALRLANALVGNPQRAAGLEIALLGPALRVEAAGVRIAAVGPVALGLEREGQPPVPLETGRTHRLARGDLLRLGAVDGAAVACLAVAGGFDLEPFLGSLSSYARAGIGPLGGKPLGAGTRLPLRLDQAPAGGEVELPQAPDYGGGPVRVVLGPQEDRFTEEAVATFLSAEYRVGREADRMGLRLEGPALAHRGGADIASDGLVTGAIQVPGNGRPILLLNDRQTAGGYAKIATVISADLPRAGRLRPGDRLSFRAVAVEEAEALRRRQEEAVAGWIRGIRPVRPAGGIDLEALYGGNLVSGVVDGRTGTGDILDAEAARGP